MSDASERTVSLREGEIFPDPLLLGASTNPKMCPSISSSTSEILTQESFNSGGADLPRSSSEVLSWRKLKKDQI